MQKLPNAQGAVIEVGKLRDYCLSNAHPRGRHKARVFREALGLTSGDTAWLQREILDGIQNHSAEKQNSDDFGSRWCVDLPMTRQNQKAVVRTIWMMSAGEDVPRLITCWVL
jgi:hypothetical protein